MPVAGRVEEEGPHVLRNAVPLEHVRTARRKAAAAVLQEEPPGLLLRPAEEDVVQPVAVHVRHRHERALPREHLRHQTLPIEIDEGVLPVHEVQRHTVGDVGEQDPFPSRRRRRARAGGRLPDGDALVRRHGLQHADPAVGPLDREHVDGIEASQPERQHVIDARLEAPRRHQLLDDELLAGPQRHPRPDPEAVGSVTLEDHLEVPVGSQCAGVVAVDRGLVVHVAHDEIERAVAVQVAVRRPVREPLGVQPPGGTGVREGQVPLVPEGVIRESRGGHPPDESEEVDPLPHHRRTHGLVGRQERDVILRRHVPEDPVRDVDVLAAVQIEVGDQGAPTPVGSRHAGQLSHLAERAVAVVPVQHVAHELVVVAVLQLVLVARPVLEGGGRLQSAVAGGQHVGDVDVQPPVVVHVGHVQPHRGEADGGHLPLERLGEGPVPIVEIEVVALEEVVGDVDVGPPVAVHVSHRHPQPERDLAPVDPRFVAHVHEPVAEIAIELVAAPLVPLVTDVPQAEAGHRPGRVVDQIEVQVPVAIVVEERRVGRVSLVREAVGLRPLLEHGDPVGIESLVQVQLVGPPRPGCAAGVADVEVQEAVAVHVREGGAGRPRPLAADAGLVRHVAEPERPLVEVEAVRLEVGGEEQLRQPVPGQVRQGDPPAVVVVAVEKDVLVAGLPEPVLEPDTGVGRRQLGEELVADRRDPVRPRRRSRLPAARAGDDDTGGQCGPAGRPCAHARSPGRAEAG